MELLGLPVGDYVVRVRCRSQNYGLWSKWSSTMLISIPARPPAGAPTGRVVMKNSDGTMIVNDPFSPILSGVSNVPQSGE